MVLDQGQRYNRGYLFRNLVLGLLWYVETISQPALFERNSSSKMHFSLKNFIGFENTTITIHITKSSLYHILNLGPDHVEVNCRKRLLKLTLLHVVFSWNQFHEKFSWKWFHEKTDHVQLQHNLAFNLQFYIDLGTWSRP